MKRKLLSAEVGWFSLVNIIVLLRGHTLMSAQGRLLELVISVVNIELTGVPMCGHGRVLHASPRYSAYRLHKSGHELTWTCFTR